MRSEVRKHDNDHQDMKRRTRQFAKDIHGYAGLRRAAAHDNIRGSSLVLRPEFAEGEGAKRQLAEGNGNYNL